MEYIGLLLIGILIGFLAFWFKNKNNQTKKSIAINEVSILRQSRQAASLSINHGSNNQMPWIDQ